MNHQQTFNTFRFMSVKNVVLQGMAMLVFLGMGFSIKAQQTYSLDACISMAQEKSPESAIAKKAFESVYWSYEAYRAGLKPQVRLGLNTPGIARSIVPVIRDDGTQAFTPQNQAFSSANLVISQVIAPTGGNVSLISGLNRQDVFGTDGYKQYNSVPFIVRYQQPLFAFNQLKWDKMVQPIQFQRAEKQYLEAIEDISVDICGKYFDLYIAQLQLVNASRNERINDSIYTISQGRFKVGKIAENDLLQTELAAFNARAAVKDAQLAVEKAGTDLAISLGLPEGQDFELVPPRELERAEIDVDFAVSQARNNRSDALNFDLQRIEADRLLSQARANARFSVDLDASVGLNQAGGTLDEAYSSPLDQQSASVGLSIPILQWGRGKASVESANVEVERVDEQIQLSQRRLLRDVRFQVLDFMQLQDRFQLAKKSMDIAMRRFNVAKNRYLIGKIDITNLQIAQDESNTARASYFQTLKQYWMAYYQLRRSTLYDFVSDVPLVVPDLSRD